MYHLWSNRLSPATEHRCLGHRNCGQGSPFLSGVSSLCLHSPDAISQYYLYIHIHLQIYNYFPVIYLNQTSTNTKIILLTKKNHNPSSRFPLLSVFPHFCNVLCPSNHLFTALSHILVRLKYDDVPEKS